MQWEWYPPYRGGASKPISQLWHVANGRLRKSYYLSSNLFIYPLLHLAYTFNKPSFIHTRVSTNGVSWAKTTRGSTLMKPNGTRNEVRDSKDDHSCSGELGTPNGATAPWVHGASIWGSTFDYYLDFVATKLPANVANSPSLCVWFWDDGQRKN